MYLNSTTNNISISKADLSSLLVIASNLIHGVGNIAYQRNEVNRLIDDYCKACHIGIYEEQ